MGKTIPSQKHKLITLNNSDKIIGLLDLNNKNIFINSYDILTDSPASIDFSKNDLNTFGIISHSGVIDIFDIRNFEQNGNKSNTFKGHNGIGRSISFPYNNEYCFSTCDNSEIVLWDKRNYSKRCFSIKKEGVESIEFLNNDFFQVLISVENKVEIFDFAEIDGEDKGIKFLYLGHTFNGVKVKSNGSFECPLVASCDIKSRSLHVWQLGQF